MKVDSNKLVDEKAEEKVLSLRERLGIDDSSSLVNDASASARGSPEKPFGAPLLS